LPDGKVVNAIILYRPETADKL